MTIADTIDLPSLLRPPADHPAALYPPHREPDEYDIEYLLEVAAAATVDSWHLVGHRRLVEAICQLAIDQSERVKELEQRIDGYNALRLDAAIRNATLAITQRSYDDVLDEIRVDPMDGVS